MSTDIQAPQTRERVEQEIRNLDQVLRLMDGGEIPPRDAFGGDNRGKVQAEQFALHGCIEGTLDPDTIQDEYLKCIGVDLDEGDDPEEYAFHVSAAEGAFAWANGQRNYLDGEDGEPLEPPSGEWMKLRGVKVQPVEQRASLS